MRKKAMRILMYLLYWPIRECIIPNKHFFKQHFHSPQMSSVVWSDPGHGACCITCFIYCLVG